MREAAAALRCHPSKRRLPENPVVDRALLAHHVFSTERLYPAHQAQPFVIDPAVVAEKHEVHKVFDARVRPLCPWKREFLGEVFFAGDRTERFSFGNCGPRV